MKFRSWLVSVGSYRPFTMICDEPLTRAQALQVVRGQWATTDPKTIKIVNKNA